MNKNKNFKKLFSNLEINPINFFVEVSDFSFRSSLLRNPVEAKIGYKFVEE